MLPLCTVCKPWRPVWASLPHAAQAVDSSVEPQPYVAISSQEDATVVRCIDALRDMAWMFQRVKSLQTRKSWTP
eukprot:4560369-Amphidinium_carterae.1